uniref:(northern house mosquito) hypothetical protein n=1 Tax=Culex pipiens TaxID=7175 RepID=A0A8D8MH10_CULPI
MMIHDMLLHVDWGLNLLGDCRLRRQRPHLNRNRIDNLVGWNQLRFLVLSYNRLIEYSWRLLVLMLIMLRWLQRQLLLMVDVIVVDWLLLSIQVKILLLLVDVIVLDIIRLGNPRLLILLVLRTSLESQGLSLNLLHFPVGLLLLISMSYVVQCITTRFMVYRGLPHIRVIAEGWQTMLNTITFLDVILAGFFRQTAGIQCQYDTQHK